MDDFETRLVALVEAEVLARIEGALESRMFDSKGRESAYAAMHKTFGSRTGDVLAELYAEAVKRGHARPVLCGQALRIAEYADFASLEVPQLRDEDGSEAWLRLHSAGA